MTPMQKNLRLFLGLFPGGPALSFAAATFLFLVFFLAFSAFAVDDSDDHNDDDDHGNATQVVINNLEDLDLGVWQGQAGLSSYTDHCVAATSGHYSIFATGNGPGGTYQLSSGGATLPFRLFYRDDKHAAFVEIPASTPIANFESGKKPWKCKKQNQRLEVRLQATDMAQVPAGAYSGYLVVTVTPL